MVKAYFDDFLKIFKEGFSAVCIKKNVDFTGFLKVLC